MSLMLLLGLLGAANNDGMGAVSQEWVECNKGTPRQRMEKLVEILSRWNSGATVKVQE